jgi:hypothetical protein
MHRTGMGGSVPSRCRRQRIGWVGLRGMEPASNETRAETNLCGSAGIWTVDEARSGRRIVGSRVIRDINGSEQEPRDDA